MISRAALANLKADNNIEAVGGFDGSARVMGEITFLQDGEVIQCPDTFEGHTFKNKSLTGRRGTPTFFVGEVLDSKGKGTGEIRHLYSGIFSRRLGEYEEVTVGDQKVIQIKKNANGENIYQSMSGTVIDEFNQSGKYANLNEQMSIFLGRKFKVTARHPFQTRSYDGKTLQNGVVYQLDWC